MTDSEHNEIPENEKPEEEDIDIVSEMAALGKKFAEAINVAWESEERRKLQSDIKEGLNRFTSEVDGALKKIRKSETAQKVEEGVQKAAQDVKSGKVADNIRQGAVTTLRSLSEALDRMSESFTPVEGEAEEDVADE